MWDEKDRYLLVKDAECNRKKLQHNTSGVFDRSSSCLSVTSIVGGSYVHHLYGSQWVEMDLQSCVLWLKLGRWLLLLLQFELDDGYRAVIRNQAPDALLQFETGRVDSTRLDDDFRETLVSVIEHREEKINDDHVSNFNSLFTCQQCDDTPQNVNCALLEVVVIAHYTTTHMATEKNWKLEEILQAHASLGEGQAAANINGLWTSLFTYERDNVFVRPALGDGTLQKPVPVALRSSILHHSHYLTLARLLRERCKYDFMRSSFLAAESKRRIYDSEKLGLICLG